MRTNLLIATLALAACTDNPDEGNGSSSSESSGATTSATATTASTTTMNPSTTVEPSTGPAESSGTETTAPAESSSTTAEPGTCDFAMAVSNSIADARNPTDCGQLTLDDPLMAWEDARMCTRDAQLHQNAFSFTWQVDKSGITMDRGFASQGLSMPLMYFEDDAAVGTTSITQVTCTGTGNPMGCTVAVGEPCLECLMPSISIDLCE